jgi:hypothetical protein
MAACAYAWTGRNISSDGKRRAATLDSTRPSDACEPAVRTPFDWCSRISESSGNASSGYAGGGPLAKGEDRMAKKKGAAKQGSRKQGAAKKKTKKKKKKKNGIEGGPGRRKGFAIEGGPGGSRRSRGYQTKEPTES